MKNQINNQIFILKNRYNKYSQNRIISIQNDKISLYLEIKNNLLA